MAELDRFFCEADDRALRDDDRRRVEKSAPGGAAAPRPPPPPPPPDPRGNVLRRNAPSPARRCWARSWRPPYGPAASRAALFPRCRSLARPTKQVLASGWGGLKQRARRPQAFFCSFAAGRTRTFLVPWRR